MGLLQLSQSPSIRQKYIYPSISSKVHVVLQRSGREIKGDYFTAIDQSSIGNIYDVENS